MASIQSPITTAQIEAIRLAAERASRAFEPLPDHVRGAAAKAVLTALVARGYAAKCYLPGHVEYVLTDAGLAALMARIAAD